MQVDTNFKMYSDCKKDPDTFSPTLRDYHLYLWSKPLPCGENFTLTSKETPPYYLYHKSALGEFCLSSDNIIPTYSRRASKPIADIVSAFPKTEIDDFYDLACTIGGYVVFPANKIDGKQTINQIRGTLRRQIDDRFDLTLECIRRWYNGEESPLSIHIDRYSDFFRLFDSFRGYVSFFLLEDLVCADDTIRFWLPFENFDTTKPLPSTKSEYCEYMKKVTEFVKARNSRIGDYQ
jgi:hypothetical protein